MRIAYQEVFDNKFWRNLALIVSGLIVYFLLVNFSWIVSKVGWILGLFQPFVWGFVFAFLLNGLMEFVEKRWLRRVRDSKKRRGWAVLWTFVISLGVIVILFAFLVPQLGNSMSTLVNKIPEYTQNLQQFLQEMSVEVNLDQMGETASKTISELLPSVFAYSTKVFGVSANMIIGIVLAVYMLYNKESYLKQIKKAAYVFLPDVIVYKTAKLLRYASKTFSDFFYSKLLDSLAVGVICFVGMVLLGMPYALLISVIVGLTNVIPFFGPFIGAVPSALIILAVDPVQAIWFVVFILVLQQFDGNIMGPKIMANSIGLPAIWVMFAILIGGGMFGFAGMILGIPTVAMIYNVWQEYLDARYLEKSRN